MCVAFRRREERLLGGLGSSSAVRAAHYSRWQESRSSGASNIGRCSRNVPHSWSRTSRSWTAESEVLHKPNPPAGVWTLWGRADPPAILRREKRGSDCGLVVSATVGRDFKAALLRDDRGARGLPRCAKAACLESTAENFWPPKSVVPDMSRAILAADESGGIGIGG